MSGKTIELEKRQKKENEWYVVKPGETIYSIARNRYGMVHWQQIWEHPKNEELKNRCAHENRELLAGDILYIPPHENFKNQCNGSGKHYRFKLQSYAPMPEIDSALAKKFARLCAVQAYADIENGHVGKTKKLWHLTKAGAHEALHYKLKRKLTKGGIIVGVGVTTIIVGALTGGIGVEIAIAIAGGVWAVNKIIDRIYTWNNNKRLRKLYEEEKLYEGIEKHLFGTDDKKLRDALTEDASSCVRKTVVHLRRAREIHDDDFRLKFYSDKEAQELISHGAFVCDNLISHMKSSMKFLHELNKTRNYLLPCVGMAVFFIDVYKEIADTWSKQREKVEEKIIEFMKSGKHEACVDVEKGTCFRAAIDMWQVFSPDGVLISNGDGREIGRQTKEAAVEDTGYTGRGIYSQVSIESIDPDAVQNKLIEVTKLNREKISKFKKVPDLKEHPRYSKLISDVWKRYESPSLGRSIRHKLRNNYMATTWQEKSAALLEDGLSIGVGAISGGLINSALASQGLSSLVQYAAQASATGARVAGNMGLIAGAKWASFRFGAKKKMMMDSELLEYDLPRAMKSARSIFRSEGTISGKEAKEDEFKKGAIVVEKLFKKVAYHLKKANTAAEAIQFVEIDLHNCTQCLEFAKLIYEIHHHLDKMERYLVASISLIFEVQAWVEVLMEREEAIYRSLFDENGPILKWITSSDKFLHANCQKAHLILDGDYDEEYVDADKYCYGPSEKDTIPLKPL
jgi:hypothetical protein